MNERKLKQLNELEEKIKLLIERYNQKAKDTSYFRRLALADADYTSEIEERLERGEEIPENWEPEELYGISIDCSSGWFPSQVCFNY